MDISYQIRTAEPGDAPGIVGAIREGFAPELVRLFTYGCPGMGAFVREQIAVQHLGGDMHYTVAQGEHELAGCVELRRGPEALFLNYIAVQPAFRSCGLGRRLLRTALELAGTHNQTTLSLDVLEFNTPARNWYERLGFRSEYGTSWWTLPRLAGVDSPVLVTGFAQAQACHQVYGFSRFRVTTGNGDYEVGRLGADWFRLTTRDALDAPGLGATLRRLDPGRQILLVAAVEGVPQASGIRKVAVTWRMSVELEILQEKLRG